MNFFVTGNSDILNKKICSRISEHFNLTLNKNDGGNIHNTALWTSAVFNISSYSIDELQVMNTILNNNINCVCLILDNKHIANSVYLLIKLKTFNINIMPIILLDNLDNFQIANITYILEKILFLSPILIDNIENLEPLFKNLDNYTQYRKIPSIYPNIFAKDVYNSLFKIESLLISTQFDIENPKFIALKIFEGDPYFNELKNNSIDKIINEIEIKYKLKSDEIISDQIYDFILSNI